MILTFSVYVMYCCCDVYVVVLNIKPGFRTKLLEGETDQLSLKKPL